MKAEAAVEELAKLVRARRKALSLTQQEVADLAEVSVRFLHDLESGKPTVRLVQLLRVMEALGLRLAITRSTDAQVSEAGP